MFGQRIYGCKLEVKMGCGVAIRFSMWISGMPLIKMLE